MPLSALLSYYLLIAPHLLLIVVLVALFRRGVYRQFPVFCAYIAFEIAQFVVLFAMLESPSISAASYGIGYSVGLALSTALRFGIIHEIYGHLLRNYATLHRFGKPLFRWTTIGLLLIAVLAALSVGRNYPNHILFVVNVLDRTASIVQCGLLLSLFLLSAYLGLSWRSHLFGIALGMGVFASVELAAAAILAETGYLYSADANYLTMAAYHVCVLIWIFYLLAPERSPQYKVRTVPEHDLESWNQELQRLIH
jgi:hypothetical protein